MTKENRELLYNKTADQITQTERNYLNRIAVKDNLTFQAKGIGLSAISAGILANILLPIITGGFQAFLLALTSVTVVLFTVAMSGALFLSAPSLKMLGLTRKEWKELKKTKRIKKISEIVNEFDFNRRLEMHKTNARLDEIITENSYRPINAEANIDNTEQVQEDKLSSIIKLTDKLSDDEKSTLITKLINERDTTAQVENVDDRVEETPREKDYLASALEACLEFNDKLDRDTFDN